MPVAEGKPNQPPGVSYSSSSSGREVAFAIESHVDWREIEIGGHGDRGSRARREKLGLRRALAFVNALTARGVEPERLRVMTPPFDPKARGSWIEMRVRER